MTTETIDAVLDQIEAMYPGEYLTIWSFERPEGTGWFAEVVIDRDGGEYGPYREAERWRGDSRLNALIALRDALVTISDMERSEAA